VNERDRFEVVDLGGRMILKRMLKKYNGRSWTTLICLRTGISGGLL
jgi:hypothetical protein